jgi:hypothetical protein
VNEGDDEEMFGPSWHVPLREAVHELSWLLSRGYPGKSALELVGNRHELYRRHRLAVLRCACSDDSLASRRARRVQPSELAGRPLAIDGFNVLVTIECGLAAALVLRGRDGALRDMASVHGRHRVGPHTVEALDRIAELVDRHRPSSTTWLLDAPVSNSGKLRALILERARARGLPWTVELDPDPDRKLAAFPGVIATSDSWILDQGGPWVDLPAAVVGGMSVLELG